MKKTAKKLPLPPCGIYIGSGIYPMAKDYLLCVMLGHQAWMQQSSHPLEMIDLIEKDNQGNLAQVWGVPRGYSPQVQAEWFYALDEIGIDVPPPDWKTGDHVYAVKEQVLKDHKDRFGAGLLRFMKEAKKRGIYTTFIYTNSEQKWIDRFKEVGKYYLGYDFGERYACSFKSTMERTGKPAEAITLDDLADDLLARVREFVDARHKAGWGNVMATSGSFALDYEIEGGTDIPLTEDFPFPNQNFSSAYSRGLYHQYGLPAWGSHLAHEHYAWLPNKSPYRMRMLMTAFIQKYMGGAKIIINESGNWFVECTLAEDSPRHDFPAVPLAPKDAPWGGDPSQTVPKFVPYMEEARKLYHTLDYGSKICRSYRKIISDFYDFVKANGTPEGQPETTMAVIKGRHDFSSPMFVPTYAIAGAGPHADKNPCWFHGSPERGWDIVRKTFFPLHDVCGEYVNLQLSGTPYGTVDIVSFAQSDLDAKRLFKHYKALAFSGWNSATEKQYDVLVDYVKLGGRLFVAIPHLSKNVTRNYLNYGVDELVRGGDFSELCGVKVLGRGGQFYWSTAPRDGDGRLGFRFPRRFGINFVHRGKIEITDPKAEVLLVDDEQASPLLLSHKLGKGEVLFLNSWAYPGDWECDFGPGGRVGSTGLIGCVYRYLAMQTKGKVWISDPGADAPGRECDYIAYSYFPESGDICVQNVDFGKAHTFVLHAPSGEETIKLPAAVFRRIRPDGTVCEIKA